MASHLIIPSRRSVHVSPDGTARLWVAKKRRTRMCISCTLIHQSDGRVMAGHSTVILLGLTVITSQTCAPECVYRTRGDSYAPLHAFANALPRVTRKEYSCMIAQFCCLWNAVTSEGKPCGVTILPPKNHVQWQAPPQPTHALR